MQNPAFTHTASAVSLQVLESDCAQLEKYLKSAKSELQSNAANQRLSKFVAEYDGKVAAVRDDLRQALALFKQARCTARAAVQLTSAGDQIFRRGLQRAHHLFPHFHAPRSRLCGSPDEPCRSHSHGMQHAEKELDQMLSHQVCCMRLPCMPLSRHPAEPDEEGRNAAPTPYPGGQL